LCPLCFHESLPHRLLHPFPTRRSSDLDALSVLFPAGDPLYKKLRPKLALNGGTAFAEDDRLRWHPAAGGLAALHAERKVTVMPRSEEHTSELQSRGHLVCRLLLEKKKT